MVLGLRSRHRKAASVQVDYIVHVVEIKPWPPSQSLRSVRSVLLQWENGDQNSGSLTSGVGDTKIEFNESITLPLTLSREKRAHDKFQKNCLEFNLYEPRTDKSAKSQLLGTAMINLAEYGIIEENLTISAPLNCKKSSKNTVQPILFVKIQPIDKDSSNSSPKGDLSKEVSLDKDGQDSISEIMNEENDDDSEIASFTDDDVSSHSSRTIASSSSALEASGASPYRNEKDGLEPAMEVTGKGNGHLTRPLKAEHILSSINLSSDFRNPENNHTYVSKSPERNVTSLHKASVTPPVQSVSSSLGNRDTTEESRNHMRSFEQKTVREDFHEDIGKIEEHARNSGKDELFDALAEQASSSNTYNQVDVNSKPNIDDAAQASQWRKNVQVKAIPINDLYVDKEKSREEIERDERILEEMRASANKQAGKFSQAGIRKQGALRSNTLTSDRRALGVQETTMSNSKLKHMKSVQLPPHSAKASGFPENIQNVDKVRKIDNIITSNVVIENKEPQHGPSDDRVEMLEEELREAAAIEVGLYSIVAEHGSSINKVHAPARRLSRFYLHACKARSKDKRASAARATVSGLVLVSKACGNDVPRLTFWLSNSIMLRAIVSQSLGELQLSDGDEAADSIEEFDDWQDPKTFIIALEKVEAWIFSRIIESVWWQTLTPHMQSTAASSISIGSSSRKTNGKRYALGDQEQGNFSIELWKKAFKDACERLCPIRAGGHECGCLPVARLVMEQLVNRLDVAMFNAILRESDEEMPTDPVSDPIGDSKVLPIPAGRTSFGAGAQLKNAIGNWSRWLTDLFGIEDNDFPEENDSAGHKRPEFDTSFKPFRLLNALSDLMMLPSEMLADVSTRKEVCPIFGTPLIKRVVYNFVPDEFCPHPIPDTVLDALDSEDDASESIGGDSLTSFPCIATPTVYRPPPAASLAGIIGQVGNQALQRSKSSVLKKAYTSDDELDELDSPLTSILNDNFRASPTFTKATSWMPKGKGGRKVVRYELLREVWRDGE